MKITLNDVSKYIVNKKQKEAIYVLYHASATFSDKAINVLLGKSGAGKTILLKTLSGIETIDDGEILFDDQDVTHLSPSKRNVSYLSQNYALYPHLTIFDNVAYPLKLQGIDGDEIRERVNKILKELKIDHLKTRKPKELSGGEMQRTALARAIVKRPDAIFLDEPLSNVDKSLRLAFLDLIKEINKKYQITMVYVTHSIQEAWHLADTIAIIDNGEIKESGKMQDLYNDKTSFFYLQFIKPEEDQHVL